MTFNILIGITENSPKNDINETNHEEFGIVLVFLSIFLSVTIMSQLKGTIHKSYKNARSEKSH